MTKSSLLLTSLTREEKIFFDSELYFKSKLSKCERSIFFDDKFKVAFFDLLIELIETFKSYELPNNDHSS